MPAERNVTVTNPMGIAWAVKFKSAEAAWRRVVRPQMRNGESEVQAQARLVKIGWKVTLPIKIA